ncbi:hypothetical protein PVAP13_2NG336078 [Panicum virgatum]|uniref:Uncharacterized protein n=1 Tax=Panicum virgatum TaxID=38727 RepID=A0A8T0VIU1_PANVG|nr:hypothetical protein PVAP13_2NG336078 [Panicum virgatum]
MRSPPATSPRPLAMPPAQEMCHHYSPVPPRNACCANARRARGAPPLASLRRRAPAPSMPSIDFSSSFKPPRREHRVGEHGAPASPPRLRLAPTMQGRGAGKMTIQQQSKLPATSHEYICLS